MFYKKLSDIIMNAIPSKVARLSTDIFVVWLYAWIVNPKRNQLTICELTTLCGKFHLSEMNAHLMASEITPPPIIILLHPILANFLFYTKTTPTLPVP